MAGLHRIFIPILASALAAACDRAEPPASPTSTPPQVIITALRIDGLPPTMVAGVRRQLSVVATFSDGATRDVASSASWQTSDSSIANVLTGGVLTTVAAGTVDITASSQGKAASARLVVEPRPIPPVTSISGVIHEAAPRETVPVAGARMTIDDGPDAGRTTLSTINGQFLFSSLSGSVPFTIRASKPAYANVSYRVVELPRDARPSVFLAPVIAMVTREFRGNTTGDEVFRYAFTPHADGQLDAGVGALADPEDSGLLQVELWHGSSRLAGAQTPFDVMERIAAGRSYEVRLSIRCLPSPPSTPCANITVSGWLLRVQHPE